MKFNYLQRWRLERNTLSYLPYMELDMMNQGWADSPLTEEGKVIAIESGKRLAAVPFNRVYSSDLGRTVETAELILQQNHYNCNLEINKRKAFREAFFRGFEGEYLEEALRKIAQDNGYHYNRAIGIFQNHSNEEVLN